MHIFQVVSEYLWANKEWLFGGIGVTFLTSLWAAIGWFRRRRLASGENAETKRKVLSENRGFDRAPRLEFADGIVAEVALGIELRTENPLQFFSRFKTEEDMHATFTPRIHMRMAQLMEAHTYEQAKLLRPEFEKQLWAEFAPQYREYGMRLRGLWIGTFVRAMPNHK
jgi:hypothetical protein